MATQTSPVVRSYHQGGFNELPVIAADIIYEGAAVGDNGSGFSRPLVAGDPFQGFAEDTADNSAGSAGDKRVRLMEEGFVELSVTGVTGHGDKDDTVYASDDNTFTKVSTSNSDIGKIVRWISGTTCVVHFQAVGLRSL